MWKPKTEYENIVSWIAVNLKIAKMLKKFCCLDGHWKDGRRGQMEIVEVFEKNVE